MFDKRGGVAFVTRIPVGLPERREVLVPIEFPDQLVLSGDLRIQEVDAAPMPASRPRSRDGLPVPIDRSADIHAPPEEVELSLANAVGRRDDMPFELRPAAAERGHHVCTFAERREKTWRCARAEPLKRGARG